MNDGPDWSFVKQWYTEGVLAAHELIWFPILASADCLPRPVLLYNLRILFNGICDFDGKYRWGRGSSRTPLDTLVHSEERHRALQCRPIDGKPGGRLEALVCFSFGEVDVFHRTYL